MLETSLLAHLNLSPLTTRVHIVPHAWHCIQEKNIILVPASIRPPAHGTLLVVVPLAPAKPRHYQVTLFSMAEVTKANKVGVTPPNRMKEQRMRQLVLRRRGGMEWQWPLLPRQFPFLRFNPIGMTQEMTMDKLKSMLAKSLQATAEWHIYSSSLSVPMQTELLMQYGDIREEDSLFAMLVLPYTQNVRPDASKNVIKMTKGDQILKVFQWKEAAMTLNVRLWLQAGDILAQCFSSTLNLTNEELKQQRFKALDDHEQWCRHKSRLPLEAFGWIERLRNKEHSLLTELTEGVNETDQWMRTQRHIRADIARWCIAYAPRPKGEEQWNDEFEQYFGAAAGFIREWDHIVDIVSYSSSEQERLVGWGRLAERMAQVSDCPLVQRDVIRQMRLEQEELSLAREKQLAYFRALMHWEGVTQKNRRQRLEAIEATTFERLHALFVSPPRPHVNIPACIRSVIERGRSQHHLIWDDRCILSKWLVSLQSMMRRPPNLFKLLADFALGVDLCASEEECARVKPQVEIFVGHLIAASTKRPNSANQSPGRSCSGIIAATLKVKDERFATRCPFASLHTVNSENGMMNVKPCVTACAQSSPGAPVVYHPLDRLLWAKESGKLGKLLDW
jgi:hypothetical protein